MCLSSQICFRLPGNIRRSGGQESGPGRFSIGLALAFQVSNPLLSQRYIVKHISNPLLSQISYVLLYALTTCTAKHTCTTLQVVAAFDKISLQLFIPKFLLCYARARACVFVCIVFVSVCPESIINTQVAYPPPTFFPQLMRVEEGDMLLRAGGYLLLGRSCKHQAHTHTRKQTRTHTHTHTHTQRRAQLVTHSSRSSNVMPQYNIPLTTLCVLSETLIILIQLTVLGLLTACPFVSYSY